MTFRRLVLASLFCVLTSAAMAQLRSVTVDLHTGVITGAVPFDEPFRITGSADLLARSVSLTYGELPEADCRSKRNVDAETPAKICDAAAQPKFSDEVSAADWVRKGPGAASFAFVVQPLDPRSCYGFRFVQHLAPLGEDDRKKVRESLSKRFRTLLIKAIDKGTFKKSDQANIQTTINKEAQEAVSQQFMACLDADTIKLSADNVEKVVDRVFDLAAAVNDADANIKNRRADVRRAFCIPAPCLSESERWARGLPNALGALLGDSRVLTPASQLAWEAVLNPTREGHTETTMIHVARALAAADERALKDLIDGKRKFAGPTLAPTSTADPQSIALLDDFLDVYASPSFRRKLRGGSVPVADASLAESLRFNVNRLAELEQQHTSAKQELDKTTLPDVFAEEVLDRGFNLSVTPTVITEGKNPYIGADFGVAHVGNIDKTLMYFGANFYFVPLNKDERNVPRWSWKAIPKRGSVLVGLAPTGLDGGNTKNLFGAGNVMAGVGWRFSRYVKVSGGAIAFKQKDENPIVDKEHIKTEPFVSMSFDLDLKQFLGGVGKLFGL